MLVRDATLGESVVSIVVPAVTETDSLEQSVRSLVRALPGPLEVIVVSNATNPSTPEVARRLADELPQVTAVVHPGRMGKGWAIIWGLTQARGQVLGFCDADGPFDAGDLARMVDSVQRGDCDCAIASKWLGHSYRQVQTYTLSSKKAVSRALNLATRGLFRLPFADTQGGAKFFSRRAWESIDQRFTCLGFDFDVELLWKLHRAGAQIQERYLPCRASRSTSIRPVDLARMVRRLLELRLRGPR
jgi:glycosyltransferase involved in cell wall biosynthesis